MDSTPPPGRAAVSSSRARRLRAAAARRRLWLGHSWLDLALGTPDEHAMYLTQMLGVPETSITHTVAALFNALHASRDSQNAHDENIKARLDRIEHNLQEIQGKTTSLTGDMREGTVRAEVSALMIPALAMATEKWAGALATTSKEWAGALGNAVEMIRGQGYQLGRVCDEMLKVKSKSEALEAMALYAAPGLHKRFIQGR